MNQDIERMVSRQRQLAILRKARAVRKRNLMMQKKGGFIGALAAAAPAIHSALQKYRPVSAIRDIGKSFGAKLPAGRLGEAIGKVGSILIDKLGYGMRRRRRRSMMRRGRM